MNKDFKVILVMNVMYNFFLAILLSIVAQILNMGRILFPAILPDILISFVLEMIIALCLPFTKWGMALGSRFAEPGSVKYRFLMAGGTAVPFAVVMCLCMCFYSVILISHLPLAAFFAGFKRMLPVFLLLAWICSFLFIPAFMRLAHKIMGVSDESR